MALEGIQGIYLSAYQYRTRAEPEGDIDKHRGYFPVPSKAMG